jgi:hypothetical protein
MLGNTFGVKCYQNKYPMVMPQLGPYFGNIVFLGHYLTQTTLK